MSQTRDGGKPDVKPLPYSKPQGPTNQMREAPGLGGYNHGNCGSQGEHSISGRETGSPGIGGSTSKSGSQR